jgi:hypothetical protein
MLLLNSILRLVIFRLGQVSSIKILEHNFTNKQINKLLFHDFTILQIPLRLSVFAVRKDAGYKIQDASTRTLEHNFTNEQINK